LQIYFSKSVTHNILCVTDIENISVTGNTTDMCHLKIKKYILHNNFD